MGLRILHTADWHLGQTLHGFDRSHEHGRFLDWLLGTLEAERADALLIAGDVFDSANPPAAAQRALNRFLADARRRVPQLQVVLIAGNHDSPARLETTAPLLESLDARVIGWLPRDAAGEPDPTCAVVPLRDRDGRIAAWCLALPFLRPGDVPRVEAADDAYAAGTAELYRRALELGLARREPGQALLAMGHLHLAGGRTSELSERRIVIGGAEAMPAGLFDPRLAYVALGHLHLAQRVAGQARLRYAGSPLPMSFAETRYPHQMVRIELDGERLAAAEPIAVPRFVELLRLPEAGPASLAEVEAALAALALPERPEDERPYLEVRVRLSGPEPGLRARIEATLEGKPVRLARIEPHYARADAGAVVAAPEQLERLQPEDVFRRLYAQRYGAEPPEPLARAFAELLLEAQADA